MSSENLLPDELWGIILYHVINRAHKNKIGLLFAGVCRRLRTIYYRFVTEVTMQLNKFTEISPPEWI